MCLSNNPRLEWAVRGADKLVTQVEQLTMLTFNELPIGAVNLFAQLVSYISF